MSTPYVPRKNPFLTNCKFRETIFANHNHHYNISRHDILAYVPVERDEGPTWVPPPPPPKKPPPVIVKIPVKARVDVKEKEPEKAPPPKVERSKPKAVPVAPPEKVKVYPFPKPGVYEKVDRRMIGP